MLHTKYTVRNKRPSYAFLMEMLWVCGFFAIAACIFVMAFAKADSMSRKAQDLNEAVMAAEQEMEHTFLSERPGASAWIRPGSLFLKIRTDACLVQTDRFRRKPTRFCALPARQTADF